MSRWRLIFLTFDKVWSSITFSCLLEALRKFWILTNWQSSLSVTLFD